MEWWKQKIVVAKIIMKYLYLKMLQSLYLTVIHTHRNRYEIQYVLHDKIYRMRTQVRRGPTKILQILDAEDNDITDDIRSYLGPNEDFHGQQLRPCDFGYEKVCFFLRNGMERVFEAEEIIQLT